jgi:hypothetical protein
MKKNLFDHIDKAFENASKYLWYVLIAGVIAFCLAYDYKKEQGKRMMYEDYYDSHTKE